MFKTMLTTIAAVFSAIGVFFASLFGLPLKDGTMANDGYIYKNMEYGYHERQVVDLFLPENNDGEVGLILLIHGGAWIAGDKDSYDSMARQYVKTYGCAVAALNYRYISRINDIHDELDDIDMCLARVKSKAAEKGIRLTGVLLTGHSAGAHLSMLYAYSRKDTAPITPKAVINNSGPTDLTDESYYNNDNPIGSNDEIASLFSDACGKRFRYKNRSMAYSELMAVSPVAYVGKGTVPTVINHGVVDSIVPFSNAKILVEKLDEYGVKYDFNIFPNSNHGLESDPDKLAKADELFAKYMAKYIGVENGTGGNYDYEEEVTTEPTTVTTTRPTTTQPTTQPTTTEPVTTAPTTQPTTEPYTTESTTVPSDEKPYRIAKYRSFINREEIYCKFFGKYANGSNMPIEFVRNSKGDMYMDINAEDARIKLYYTSKDDKMDAYIYLSDELVGELLNGENEALKLFLKGFVSLLGTTPLHAEVPKDKMEALKMKCYRDLMLMQNIGTIVVGKDFIDSKQVDVESFVDTETGDTKKYYFDGDKLIAIDTIYKDEKLGFDRLIVHELGNDIPEAIFTHPSPSIKIPAGLM